MPPQPTRRRRLRRALLALLATMALGACAPDPGALEATAAALEQAAGVRLTPAQPVEVIYATLYAIDRGDLPAAKALFAGAQPRRDAAVADLLSRWPGHSLHHAEATLSVGPYQTRPRLAPARAGLVEAIPVRLSGAGGSLELRLVLQMTGSGWRLIEVQ